MATKLVKCQQSCGSCKGQSGTTELESSPPMSSPDFFHPSHPLNIHQKYPKDLTLSLRRLWRSVVCSSQSQCLPVKQRCNLSDSSECHEYSNQVVSSKYASDSFKGFYGRRRSWAVLVIFYVFLLLGSSEGCGPGRGAGRRRAPRKLTPLVYQQHVPNVRENTLSASGPDEGRITRDNQRFKNLVPNYNQDIIFRDDEGTGADRLMTQRCKEKLNTLAISVMNQWPGVKLRVIEAWNEENRHAHNSLHYEGRAVDITTSDKDRSKYGMLARLAVEAGFDWVYYEARAHIHCSVKPDSSQSGRTGGCFSGNSTVETPLGPRKISDIQPGDKLLTVNEDGSKVFSDVLMFLDRNTSEIREFFEIKTSQGSSITMTPSHLLYTIQPESLAPDTKYLISHPGYLLPSELSQVFLAEAAVTFARRIQNGDILLVSQPNGQFSLEEVTQVTVRVDTGVYAPLTTTGNLLVDGVLSSCYAVIEDQQLAHSVFMPFRLSHNLVDGVSYLWRTFSRFVSFGSETRRPSLMTMSQRRLQNDRSQGIHWYARALYFVSQYVLPNQLLYGA